MHVVFHIGAHNTDRDGLVKSLLKNRGVLLDRGVVVPGPGRYRKTLRDVVTKLRGARASAEAQDVILEAITESDSIERVFLSNESFICVPDRVLDEGELYQRAFKTVWLRNCFPDAKVDFAIGMRNMATFLPALYQRRTNQELDFEEYLTGVDPFSLRWSDVLRRIRIDNPDSRIIAWCNEDTPLIWGDVMRRVCGTGADVPLAGELDIADRILSPEHARELATLLATNPPASEAGRRTLIRGYLESHALAGETDQEIDIPGWDSATVERLSELYDRDMERVASLEGVDFLTP